MSQDKELKKLGRKIAKMRYQINLSQDELAHLSNCTKRTIERIELGQQEPKIFTVLRISKALKISLSDLISDH